MDMAAIWQEDNKNSSHSLIEKYTEIIVLEPLRFILLLSAYLLPQKIISARRNVFQLQKHPAHPTKMQTMDNI